MPSSPLHHQSQAKFIVVASSKKIIVVELVVVDRREKMDQIPKAPSDTTPRALH
jgi:hypothetical protein